MATHPSVLAWKIPWTEEPAWQDKIHKELDANERLSCSHQYLSIPFKPSHFMSLISLEDYGFYP